MKLGIMSDSHGKTNRVRQAIALLAAAGAEAIIHCGDVGGLNVLEELAGWPCWFVWGNTDWPQASWRSQVQALGLPWPANPLSLKLAGKSIAVFHGHEREFARQIRAANYDYLFHGHSHQCEDYRIGPMRIVNPGSLHRVRVKTVALLNLADDHLDFLELDAVHH